MSDFFFTNIMEFFGLKHPANIFNSISEPIFAGSESYLESVLFAFLDLIRRSNNKKKWNKFIENFENRSHKMKPYFKENPEKLKKISSNTFEKFSKLFNKLQQLLDYFTGLFSDRNTEEAILEDLRCQKKTIGKYFKMIMKILILSELIDDEDDEERQKAKRNLIKDQLNKNDMVLINRIIAKVLEVNTRIFYQNPDEKPTRSFFDKTKRNDSDYEINLMIEESGSVRILTNETDFSFKEKLRLRTTFEEDKNNLEGELRRQIKDYAKLKDHIYECYDNTIKHYFKYVAAMLRQETLEMSKFKETFKSEMKSWQTKVLQKEKEMKERYGLEIKAKEKFLNLSKYMKAIKGNLLEISDMKSGRDKLETENPEDEESNICDKCNKNAIGERVEFECGCKICGSCFTNHLNVLYEFKLGDADIPCCNPNCNISNPKFKFIKYPRSFELIERYLGNKKAEDFKSIHKKRMNASAIRSQIICPVDGEPHRIDEMVTFDCDCKICEECCINYLTAIKDTMDCFEIPCFDVNCKAPKNRRGIKNGIYLFERLIGKDECERINFALANKQAKFVCSNPDCPVTFDLAGGGNQDFFLCECGAETCLNCKKKRHKGRECDKVDAEVKNFLKQEGNVTRICPNPVCLQPVTKDDHCDHVKCPYCKVEFCFVCSCLRSPTIEHGNHYHRKDCKHYSPWIDKDGKEVFDDKVEKKCSECVRLGKLCERPKQTIREFYVENKALEYLEIVVEEKKE